jgi:uncharacterized protein with HEPN domain
MTIQEGRHADYLALMRGAAIQARSYVDGMSKEDFLADAKTQDAVIMKLLVIGELASQLLDEQAACVTDYSEIPWHQMKGMRNRMAHGYFELDLDVVWETILTAIPDLLGKLNSIV